MAELSGRTRLLGVLGNPVGHSLSPLLQNFFIQELDLDFCYLPFEVSKNSLPSAVAGMRALGVAGLNITAPHKEAILPFVEKLSSEAREIGAVNTICRKGRELAGYNTDAEGFLAPLDRRGIHLRGMKAVVLGAGGAAAAVIYALLQREAGQITIISRNRERAVRLASRFGNKCKRLTARQPNGPQMKEEILAAQMLINATPLGGPALADKLPAPGDALQAHTVVYDLVYSPPRTHLLVEAEARGATAIGGIEMLVEQGARSLELWSSVAVPTHLRGEAITELTKRGLL